MCTVTFYPKESSYLVGMNRDELLTRGPAQPPRVYRHATGSAIYPTDAEGGTWIAVTEVGITLAILNWNEPPRTPKARSRGHAIIELLSASCRKDVETLFEKSKLAGMRPFRLIGFFPGELSIREWRWNGSQLDGLSFEWRPHNWFSSGLSDEEAALSRGRVTSAWNTAANAGTPEWLRNLHASHLPERGAFSLCVHRDDAATLSYTEIAVSTDRVSMRYRDGSPCDREEFDSELSLPRLAVQY